MMFACWSSHICVCQIIFCSCQMRMLHEIKQMPFKFLAFFHSLYIYALFCLFLYSLQHSGFIALYQNLHQKMIAISISKKWNSLRGRSFMSRISGTIIFCRLKKSRHLLLIFRSLEKVLSFISLRNQLFLDMAWEGTVYWTFALTNSFQLYMNHLRYRC